MVKKKTAKAEYSVQPDGSFAKSPPADRRGKLITKAEATKSAQKRKNTVHVKPGYPARKKKK